MLIVDCENALAPSKDASGALSLSLSEQYLNRAKSNRDPRQREVLSIHKLLNKGIKQVIKPRHPEMVSYGDTLDIPIICSVLYLNARSDANSLSALRKGRVGLPGVAMPSTVYNTFAHSHDALL
jgi:hypothetical protein